MYLCAFVIVGNGGRYATYSEVCDRGCLVEGVGMKVDVTRVALKRPNPGFILTLFATPCHAFFALAVAWKCYKQSVYG